MKGDAGLTKRQLQVLPYLLACGTYEEAAFKEELDRRRNQIIEGAVNKLKFNTSKAVDTLIALLSHSNPTIQRGVANDLLNHVARFIEPRENRLMRCM